MECDYSSHPYLKIYKDFKTTRARAPRGHRAALEVLGGGDMREVQELLDDGFDVLEDLRLLGYEELGGLSDPGPHDISCGTVLCEI